MKFPWTKDKVEDKSKLPGKTPKEVEEYYKSNRRGFNIAAILLALATIALTVLLALGIFLAGRWLYRYAFSNNDPQPTTNQPETANPQQTGNPQSGNADPNDDENATSDNNDTDNDSQADETPDSGPSTPESTPRTGPTEIPHTGPTGDE